MSKEYDNTNRGALFKNTRRDPESQQPEYNGSLNVGGVEYWLSAWVKDGAKGKFFSIAVKRKDEQPATPKAKPASGGGGIADMEDDIPF